MAMVGLKDIVYAKLLTDTDLGATYEAPAPLAPAITASVETSVNSATQYADNGPIAVMTQTGETSLSLTVDEIPMDVLADLLGYELKKGVLIHKQDVVAPYVAIGFKGDKSSGGERYVWLYKGRFTVPSDSWNTKTDSPEFQNQEISGTFIRRDFDGVFKAVADTDVTEFAAHKASFFTEVFDLADLNTI